MENILQSIICISSLFKPPWSKEGLGGLVAPFLNEIKNSLLIFLNAGSIM